MTELDVDKEAIEYLKDTLHQISTTIGLQKLAFQSHQVDVNRYMQLESRVHVRDENGTIIRAIHEENLMQHWVAEKSRLHTMQTFYVQEEINCCVMLYKELSKEFSKFQTLMSKPNISIYEKTHCQQLFASAVTELCLLWEEAKYCQDYLQYERIHAFNRNRTAQYHVANFEFLVIWLIDNAEDLLSKISVFEDNLETLQVSVDDTESLIAQSTSRQGNLSTPANSRTGGIANLFHKAARKVTKNSPKVVHYELKNTILRLLKYAHELDDCIASYQHYKLSPGSDSYIWEKWPEVVLSIEKHRERYRKLKQELTNLEQDHPNSYNDWDGVRRHIQKFEDNVREPLRKTLPYHKKQIVELLEDLEDKKIKIPLSPPMHASLKEKKTGYFLESRKQSLWNGDIDKELNWLAMSRLCL